MSIFLEFGKYLGMFWQKEGGEEIAREYVFKSTNTVNSLEERMTEEEEEHFNLAQFFLDYESVYNCSRK